jgi:hypothetical protein
MVTASDRSSVNKMGLRPDLHQRPVQLRSIDKARRLLSTILCFHDLSGKPRLQRCRPSCKHRSNGQTAPSTGNQSYHPHPATPTSLNTLPTAKETATAQLGSRCGTHK